MAGCSNMPSGGKDAVKSISTQIVQIPNDITSTVILAVRNTGNVPIWDLTVNVFPGLQSALGINGLTPSAITSPNIPQTLSSTILPIGIVGPSFFGIDANSHIISRLITRQCKQGHKIRMALEKTDMIITTAGSSE